MTGHTAAMTLTDFLLARIAVDEATWSHPAVRHDGTLGEIAERVLRECEAKRRIIGTGEFPTREMKYLAAVYADHPDYREEWHP